ncbi:growth/differentiation factor 15 [Microcebus murinus]|uniref:growth/differentiation factor 15 n=1 Tax=Microcebus murinus TaxID=30608 RepID=UPI003F6CF46D
MPGPGPRPPPRPCPMLLLPLAALVLGWPPPGGALSLAQKSAPSSGDVGDVGTDDAAATGSQELRKGYEELLARLRANLSREDSNSEPAPVPAAGMLSPELRLGSDGHLQLRIARAALAEGLPGAARLRRALLRLSRTGPRPWDATQQLRRQLRLPDPEAPELHLPLSPPPTPPLSPSGSARAARRARASAGDDCPLGPGRCCRLHTVRASLDDLGWGDWVLSPRELQVTVCAGACPRRFRAANAHAQVRARLHGRKAEVPAPCCVPSGYSPVVVLQKTGAGGVALQTYDDLLARECHCV